MSATSGTPRRTARPRQLAVIDRDRCTGCQACMAVCPVDCIRLVETGLRVKGSESWCEIDLDECIGCRLCIRLPGRSGDPYPLTICPWGAIEMVDASHLPPSP